jgi:hypothetical protein
MKKQKMLFSVMSVLVMIVGYLFISGNAAALQSSITGSTSLCAVTESDYNSAVTKRAQLISQKSDVNSAIATKNWEKDKIESQISSLKSKIKDIQKYIDNNCKRNIWVCQQKAKDLKNAQGDLDSANTKLKGVKNSITSYQNQITNINKGIVAADATIDKYTICGNSGGYINPNGVCGTEVYTCTSGILSQQADADGKNKWLCIGINTGTTAQCTKDIISGSNTSTPTTFPGSNTLPTIPAGSVTLVGGNAGTPLITTTTITDPTCLGSRPSNSVLLSSGNAGVAPTKEWEYKVPIMWPVNDTCTFTCPDGTTYNATTKVCSNV